MIPLIYNFRNLWVRRFTALSTLVGIALVVAVFLSLISLAEGLSAVFIASGSPDNLLIVRQNSLSELQSGVTREQAQIIRTLPGIQKDRDHHPLMSKELVVILNLNKKEGGTANVTLRGVEPSAFALRPGLKMIKGRHFNPGLSEVIVSERIASRFKDCQLGDVINFGSYRWQVVGIFDTGGTSVDSEIWTEVEGAMSDFKRNLYSSVLVKVEKYQQPFFLAQMSADPKLALEGRNERKYYEEQTVSAIPIEFIAYFISIIMAIGAVFGTMNTMYAAVAARTKEIATLRVLGFSQKQILASFALESSFLGILGGMIGCIIGSMIIMVALSGDTGTTNVSSFSEVVFSFKATPLNGLKAGVFGIIIGALGGLLPAIKAARIPLTQGLKYSL